MTTTTPTPSDTIESLRRRKLLRARLIQGAAALAVAAGLGTCGYQQRRTNCIPEAAASLSAWTEGESWDSLSPTTYADLDALFEERVSDCVWGRKP